MKVEIKVLGCDKNTVDSEYLAGALAAKGIKISDFTGTSQNVDAIVIFTCGFIGEARRESESAIKETLRLKDSRNHKPRIIVAGCMPQRFLTSLMRKFPEVDAFCGVVNVGTLAGIVEKVLHKVEEKPIVNVEPSPEVKIEHPLKREQLVKRPYSFLRIADGCDHRCSFCIIPQIKGPYRSVPREALLDEAHQLINQGIKEINIIAQDITKYGKDLYDGRYGLVELLKDLCAIKEDFWIRLLYLYPTRIDSKLLECIAGEPKICKYIDIPLQHLDEEILKRMRRPYSWQRIKNLIQKIRAMIPEVVIRSAFIIGFPGETEKHFQRLGKRLKELKLDRVGFFLYSAEKGTKAESLSGAVPRSVAHQRLKKIYNLQGEIAYRQNQRWIGATREVMVEAKLTSKGYKKGTNFYLCRSQGEAPEVDGYVIVQSSNKLLPGDRIKAIIRNVTAYDLLATELI